VWDKTTYSINPVRTVLFGNYHLDSATYYLDSVNHTQRKLFKVHVVTYHNCLFNTARMLECNWVIITPFLKLC